jgi:predicted nucleic acid-binding protein
VDRLFLDANVLFSAAYRKDAGVRRLWCLPETELVTSAYAVEEASRNLDSAEQRSELEGLLEVVRVSNPLADPAEHAAIEGSGLPEKDLPILRAAVAANATHLITGDRRHFGRFFGKKVAGVLIVRPADHLADRGSSDPLPHFR